MPNIKSLVKDIYEVISTGRAEGSPDLSTYSLDMSSAYTSMVVPENKIRTPETLYFSEIGTPCSRKLWYKVNNTGKEQLQAYTRIKFSYGHMLEALVLQLARDAGHEVSGEQQRVEYNHPSGWRVSGRIDAIIDGVLVDVKSVSKFGKQKFENGLLDDPFGYKDQLNGYATVLKNDETGFLTIEKELGHIAYYPFGGYDSKNWDSLVDKAVSVVSSHVVPERAFEPVPQSKTSRNGKLSVNCSYCEYKQECWQDANDGQGLRGFAYSGKIEWLAEVVDLPRVPEITFEEAA